MAIDYWGFFMTKSMSDELNLMLLRELCSGNGLAINLSYLAKRLNRHRKTIRKKVEQLLSQKIISRPTFPLLSLFREYPLLVAAYADLPEDEQTHSWVREDANIFAAFRVRKGEYNTMIFEFHKNIWSYQIWRENLIREKRIPSREDRVPARALYFPNHSIKKFAPDAGVELIEKKLKKSNGKTEVSGYDIDEDSLNILKCLVKGDGIRINENYLANELKVHRKTVIRRIQKMREETMIDNPVCRFPAFFAPSGFLLVFSLVEVRKFKDKFMQDIMKDPHVSLVYGISEGRYNLLLFAAHPTFHDYLKWEIDYESRYHGLLGSVDNTFFASEMALSIDLQKVALGIIENKLLELT